MDVSLKVFGYNKTSGIEFLSFSVNNIGSSYMPTTISAVQLPVLQGNQMQLQKQEVIEADSKTLVLAKPDSQVEQLQVEETIENPVESKQEAAFRSMVEEAESDLNTNNGGSNSNTITTEKTVEVKQTTKETTVNSQKNMPIQPKVSRRLRSFGLPRFDPVGLAKAIGSKIHDVRFLSDAEVHALVHS